MLAKKRQTKIVATLGPSTNNSKILEPLIRGGVDVVRLNFSHSSAGEHRKRANLVREISRKYQRHVAVLADLQGPKIRIGNFVKGGVELRYGDNFILNPELDKHAGNEREVYVGYHDLAQDVAVGDTLLLDDGRIQLKVAGVKGKQVYCDVRASGFLGDRKGLNKLGGGLSAASLTAKDKEDIKTIAEIGADYVAVSFVRSAADIELTRQLLSSANCSAGIIAKIERAEAVDSLKAMDDIILASDGVMVARGDLGVEIGDAQLIGIQKHLIKRCREYKRTVITATQMMETMVENNIPTRAEVFDVANAVLDGTDAVMLSAETATGKYPLEAVAAMDRICLGAEKQPSNYSELSDEKFFSSIDQNIAIAAVKVARNLNKVKILVCMTESGATALYMSRISTNLPIYCLSPHVKTLRRCSLFRDVHPIHFEPRDSHAANSQKIVKMFSDMGLVEKSDLLLLTHGSEIGLTSGTNTMQVLEVK